jgi:hypothetical protein
MTSAISGRCPPRNTRTVYEEKYVQILKRITLRPTILRIISTVAAMALAGAVAHANPELRDFCADRPGLGMPACTMDTGHVMVELGLADRTLDARRRSVGV